MTVPGFYRGCSTFIFTHHKKIVPFLQSSQSSQLQDTPGSVTHCVGFYPCFQANCEQLGQLAQYRSRDTYALSRCTHPDMRSLLCSLIGPIHSLTNSSTQDLCIRSPGSGTLKCLNELISSSLECSVTL